MKLYEIDAALEALIDTETGEVADYDAFAALNMDRDAKIENMILAWKNREADIKALKEEADKLTERANIIRRRNERLKDFIARILNGEKFKTAKCDVSFRKTPAAVKIADGQEEAVMDYLTRHHDECLRFHAPDMDKAAVKELLKNGVEIPGVTLETGTSMKIT